MRTYLIEPNGITPIQALVSVAKVDRSSTDDNLPP